MVEKDKMRHLDLFSGIGGFALAASWVWGAEHEIVSFCEIESFPQKVLKKHWPDVPIHDDIKTMKGDQYGRIDLISGGFPCQPYSCAGKQKGKEDDRALWPEMFRIIQEAKPRWIIGENVAGFVNMGLDDCLSDLESEGYETTAFIIPACAVNAPHRRDRVWIVGYSKHFRLDESQNGKSSLQGGNCYQKRPEEICQPSGSDVPRIVITNAGQQSERDKESRLSDREQPSKKKGQRTNKGDGFTDENIITSNTQGRKSGEQTKQERRQDISGRSWEEPWIEVATCLCRVDDGVSGRVDRLKSLGNAIVPQVVYPIMQAIKESLK